MLGVVALRLARLREACPTEQTTGFKTLASGSQAAVAALSGAQAADLSTEQLGLVADGSRRVRRSPGCETVDTATDPCFLIVGDLAGANPGSDIAVGSQTDRMQKTCWASVAPTPAP